MKVWKRRVIGAICALGSLAGTAMAQDIVIGFNQPLSGPNAAAGQERLQVLKALVDRFNAGGGAGGRKVKVETLDDKFDPNTAAENYKQLAAGPAVAMLGCSGTSACSVIAPLVKNLKLPVVAPMAGGGPMREGFNPYVFNLRPTTENEIEAMVKQMQLVGQTKFALVYQNDGFGKSGQAAAEKVFQRNKVQPLGQFALEASGANVDEVAASLGKISGLNSVIMVASPPPTVKLIAAVRKSSAVVQFYNLAAQATTKLVKDLGKDTRGVMFTTLVPSPWSTVTPVSKEYIEITGANAEHSFMGMEFYIGSRLLLTAIHKAGPTVTRESLVRALETLEEQHYGPMRVGYSATDHEGSRYINMTVVDSDGKFRQ